MMDGSAFTHRNVDYEAEYDQFDGDVFGAAVVHSPLTHAHLCVTQQVYG